MIPAKIAALCLCPALVASPAIIATQPKVRHVVAHFMKRAADRLEAPTPVLAARPKSVACLPADSPISLSQNIAPLSQLSQETGLRDILAVATAGPLGGRNVHELSSFTAGSGIGNDGVGTGYTGGSSGGSAGGTPGQIPIPISGPLPGVTEPQNWALLVIGFGTTGMVLRARRPVKA